MIKMQELHILNHNSDNAMGIEKDESRRYKYNTIQYKTIQTQNVNNTFDNLFTIHSMPHMQFIPSILFYTYWARSTRERPVEMMNETIGDMMSLSVDGILECGMILLIPASSMTNTRRRTRMNVRYGCVPCIERYGIVYYALVFVLYGMTCQLNRDAATI